MISKVVFSDEYEHLKVASLPSNPTASVEFGGLGYNSNQMKEAFDALPLFILKKFNRLIDDITTDPEISISGELRTGIEQAPRLSDIFAHITDGQLASYLTVGEESLATHIARLREDIDEVKADIESIKARLEAKNE